MIPKGRDRPASMPLEGAERRDLDAHGLEALAPAEIGQVDDEGGPDDPAAGLADELDRRRRGAAGGDEVVDEQDMLVLEDAVGVDLDAVGAVFERVILADRLPGQLALLAHGDEAGVEEVRHGAAEDEAARLDPR